MDTTKNKVYRCHFHQEVESKHGQVAKKGHWKVRLSASAPTLPSIPSLKYRDLDIDVYTSELGPLLSTRIKYIASQGLDNPGVVRVRLGEGG